MARLVLGATLFLSATGYASKSLAQSDDTSWLVQTVDQTLPVQHVTAFARFPGKNACLIGTRDGELISVSLPDVQLTPLAKLDHSIESLAVDRAGSQVAVVTHNSETHTVAVSLVPLNGGVPVTVDQRFVGLYVHSNLHWSPDGALLGVTFVSISDAAPDWIMIDAMNHKTIHVESSKSLVLSHYSRTFHENRAIAFAGKDTFYAFVKIDGRRSSLGYFVVDRSGSQLPAGSQSPAGSLLPTGPTPVTCSRADTKSFPGSASTFFRAADGQVSVLVFELSKSRHIVYNVRREHGRLQTSTGPLLQCSNGQFILASSEHADDGLYAMAFIPPRQPMQIASETSPGTLYRIDTGAYTSKSTFSVSATSHPILRISELQQVAVCFGDGVDLVFDFADLNDSESVASKEPQTVTFEREDFYRQKGDFCGVEDQFFASINTLHEDPNRNGFQYRAPVLRVWEFVK